MATKEEIINSVEPHKVSISRKEFIRLINLVTPYDGDTVVQNDFNPQYIKKGDVYTSYAGKKKRPIVVVKVLKELVLGIPLSTTEDCYSLYPSKSRIFGEGWFCNQLVSAPIEYVISNWLGVYDNPKRVQKAIELLKLKYINYL